MVRTICGKAEPKKMVYMVEGYITLTGRIWSPVGRPPTRHSKRTHGRFSNVYQTFSTILANVHMYIKYNTSQTYICILATISPKRLPCCLLWICPNVHMDISQGFDQMYTWIFARNCPKREDVRLFRFSLNNHNYLQLYVCLDSV